MRSSSSAAVACSSNSQRREKLSLLLSASFPDPAKLFFQLSTTPRLSEDSSDSEDGNGSEEGRADEGALLRDERRPAGRIEGKKEKMEDHSWLSECIIESWGSLEYVALARGASLALLGRRGEALTLLYAKPLPLDDGEEISTVLLLGVGSRRVAGSIDGVVCLVGTSDGRLSLYSESATLLFSHRFALSPITSMRPTVTSLMLVNATEMILIDRKSLYSLVSEARKMNSSKINKRIELVFDVLVRKSVETSMDAVPCPFPPSTIDRYTEVSLRKFHGRVERSIGDAVFWLSLRDRYGAVGVWETECRERVRDTLVKWGAQYLPSFIQSAMQPPDLTPRDTKWACAWREMDEPRFAHSLHPAPEGVPYVAVADHLARVAIVEISSGEIIRIWKGYRDASCAWLSVRGEGGKRALFLAILAPRRNLLEIWSAPNGRRVAARQVRGVALLESSSEVLSDSTKKNDEEERDDDEGGRRLFLLGYKGNLYEIKVAFDSLLSLNTDDEQHDRIVLKETEYLSLVTLPGVIAALKTASAKRMALISSIHTASDVASTVSVLEELTKIDSLHSLCTSLLSLCHSYERVAGLWSRDQRSSGKDQRSVEEEDERMSSDGETDEERREREAKGRHREEEEEQQRLEGFDHAGLKELRPLIDKCLPGDCSSTPCESSPYPCFTLAEFLTSFNLHTAPLKLSLGGDPLPLLSFLFSPFMDGKVELDEFVCVAGSLHLTTAEITSLFTQYWSHTECIASAHLWPTVLLLGHMLTTARPTITSTHTTTPTTVSSSNTPALRKQRTFSTASTTSTVDVKEQMEMAARTSKDPLRGAVLLALLSLFGHIDSEADEFEPVRKDVQRMEGLLTVAPLLAALSALTPDAPPLSIQCLLEGGATLLREQVCRAASHSRLLPAQLLEDESIVSLRSHLPLSLDSSILCAEAAWTLLREWTGKSSFDSCTLAIQYAKAINDIRLRSQCAVLLWNATLLGALKAVSNQSRGAERELHSYLVPSHRVADFVLSLSSLLSSLIVNNKESEDDQAPETLSTERCQYEEWLAPVFQSNNGSSSISSSKCESLLDVLHRQMEVDEDNVQLHRQLLAAIHLMLSVGRSPTTVRQLFPVSTHCALFSALSTRIRTPDDGDDPQLPKLRAELIEKACNYPNPATRDSLLLLCTEWNQMEMMRATDARRCLRESRDEEGCLLLAALPAKRKVALLTPAVAVRLKQMSVEDDVLLSAKDERILTELAGDEYVDEPTKESTKTLLSMLNSLSSTTPSTKNLVRIANAYFGL